MLPEKTDLPLWEDPSAKYVPWIIALMVYLATAVLMTALTVGDIVDHWHQGFANKITIEIPPSLDEADYLYNNQTQKRHEQAVVHILKQTEGIKSFRPLPASEIIHVIEPWFGKHADLSDLPLSMLIEVELETYNPETITLLEEKLKQQMPTVSLEDHRVWQHGIFNTLSAIRIIGLCIVALIIFATVSTIMFTTQTSLTIHRQIIEILHLIGAHNTYIAKQFQYHAMQLGLRGGFIGFFLTFLTLFTLHYFLRDIDLDFLTGAVSAWDIWAIAIMIPLLITAFMMLSARLTVLLMLKRR